MIKTPHRREEVELPFGKGTTGDGRVYLFNRKREPLWMRFPGSPRVNKCHSGEWIYLTEQELFDSEDDAKAVLKEWGVE